METAPLPPTQAKKRRRTGLWLFLIVLAAIAVLAAVWDWNWFKGSIERRVEAATGRRLEIAGDLDVDPGLRTAIVRANDVTLANAGWSETPLMAQAEQLELEVSVWPLLFGDFVLPSARLKNTQVLLERDKQHAGNWKFDRPENRRKRRIEIAQLLVTDGELRVRDAPSRTDLTLDVKSGEPDADDALAPLLVTGTGEYRGYPFKLDGTIESPLELRNKSAPYHVDLRARAGATRAHARGDVSAMAAFRNFDVALKLQGPDLAQLDDLVDIVLQETPPYTLDGQLSRRDDVWNYRGFKGKVGDSDLSGDATLTLGGERPHMKAALVSNNLDFDDLAGFIGAPPSADSGETASPEQKREAAKLAQSARILPQRPYRLEKMRAMDADVTLDAAKVNAAPLPLEALKGHLLLENGVAKLDPLELRVAGGRIDSRITLDASRAPIASSADLTMRGLELPKLFPDARLTRESVGRIGGRIELAGRGNSVADMLATSDGQVALVMGKGRISNLLLELAGLDVQEALRFLLGKDRIIPLRCAHADFKAKNGVVTAERFVFDTTDTILYGEGTIDMRDETLHLLLRPRPKDRSLVSLRSPLEVDGSFKDPDIHPKAGPLALRGLAAAALYSVAPPAALLALLETGPGEDSNCALDPDNEAPIPKSAQPQGEPS
jgi:uncharacterized protein involved in outer membrane biogenesis